MQCISVEIHLYSPGHRSKQPRNPIARSTKWNAPAQQSLSAHATDDLSIQLLVVNPSTQPDALWAAELPATEPYLPIRDIKATMFLVGRTYQTRRFTFFVQTT